MILNQINIDSLVEFFFDSLLNTDQVKTVDLAININDYINPKKYLLLCYSLILEKWCI